MKNWILYILNKHDRYYVGITTDLNNRLSQHKNQDITTKILHTEIFTDQKSAARREQQIKGWSRLKKEMLISSSNDVKKETEA